MTVIVWIGFIVSLFCLLYIGRKNIWLGLMLAAFVLGVFNLPIMEILDEIINTLSDLSVIFLALAVGTIPIIGGLLEFGGLMDDLVENLRMQKKLFLGFAPALIGMLPMPGGALLSAPIVKRASEGVRDQTKVAINVWFRHVLILIYPLGALLVSTKMAGLNLYLEILYILPGCFLMVILGYIFILREVKGEIEYTTERNYKKLIKPLLVLFVAPAIHFIFMSLYKDIIPEIPLLIGVVVSFILALFFTKPGWQNFKRVFVRMKPWNFFLIIIGMFLYLNLFNRSGSSEVVASVAFSKSFLVVIIGAFFGFITGRVAVPVALMLPIYYSKYGNDTMNYLTFAIMFTSIFMGYMISPIHPCVSVSIEYFKSELKYFLKKLLIPTAIELAVMLILGIILI
ncbi:DUF401 family protein [bacterium]|nr:DUF401 family protein [bacterium]